MQTINPPPDRSMCAIACGDTDRGTGEIDRYHSLPVLLIHLGNGTGTGLFAVDRSPVAHADYPDNMYSLIKIEKIGTLGAKTNFYALLNQLLEGQALQSFYVTRRGKRIAELRPVAPPTHSRRAGFAKGTFTYIAGHFDAPLPDFADYRIDAAVRCAHASGVYTPALTPPFLTLTYNEPSAPRQSITM